MPSMKGVVETLDEIEDEGQRELYKEVTIKGLDGKAKKQFELQIEGAAEATFSWVMPLRNAHDRSKSENATLKAKVAEFEGRPEVPSDFAIEEWTRLKSVDEEVKKGTDPENKRAHEAEVQSIKAMHEQALNRTKTKAENDLKAKDALIAKLESALRQRVVWDDLTKALVENGVDKKYLRGARALLERSVKVRGEGGDMSAYVETDLGETPIIDFVPQWVQSEEGKLYATPARGSDASGSDLRGKGPGSLDSNPWAKASWNATLQAQVWKADAAKADRLAKNAGHRAAVGARVDDAK